MVKLRSRLAKLQEHALPVLVESVISANRNGLHESPWGK